MYGCAIPLVYLLSPAESQSPRRTKLAPIALSTLAAAASHPEIPTLVLPRQHSLWCFLYLLSRKMPVEKHREFGALQGSEPINKQSGRTASHTGVDHLPLKEGIGSFPHRSLSCLDLCLLRLMPRRRSSRLLIDRSLRSPTFFAMTPRPNQKIGAEVDSLALRKSRSILGSGS